MRFRCTNPHLSAIGRKPGIVNSDVVFVSVIACCDIA